MDLGQKGILPGVAKKSIVYFWIEPQDIFGGYQGHRLEVEKELG